MPRSCYLGKPERDTLGFRPCTPPIAPGRPLTRSWCSAVGPDRPQTPANGRTVGLSRGFRGLCPGALRRRPRRTPARPGSGRCCWHSDLPRHCARSLFRASADDLLSRLLLVAGLAPVGIAGEQTPVPLGIVATAVSVCAMGSFVALVLPVVRARMHH